MRTNLSAPTQAQMHEDDHSPRGALNVSRLPFRHFSKSALLSLFAVLILLGALIGSNQAQPAANKPAIQVVSLREVSFDKKVVTFTVEIVGDNFGDNSSDPTAVEFVDPKGTVVGTIKSKSLVSNSKIVVQAESPIGTIISVVRITVRGITVEDSNFKLSFKEPSPPPAITPFEIKHSTLSSSSSPIKTLFVTNEKGLFSSNPHRMSVEILPAGASNVLIRSGSNPYNLIVDFIAPEKFEVSGVVLTVYDSSDLDSRQPIAISQPFKEKKPQADPNQPTIASAKVVYLQRRPGVGRLTILGNGFGNYPRPPMISEDLLASYQRSNLSPGRNCLDPPICMPPPASDMQRWQTWNKEIEQLVNVVLVPRNPSLRVELIKVLYIDDKMIDLYFEFSHLQGYSLAFRPGSVALTVKKPGAKQLQILKAPGVTATIEGPESYLAEVTIGPKRDDNLTSSFTILTNDKANYEFGRGIADNFYVIKLSVVNRGEKKVSIPLAAIEADVDWASGRGPETVPNAEYVESRDPETPVPVEDVSAYFDAYLKQFGKRAKLFNVANGLTTLMTSLIPFFGPGFKDAQVVFTGGLIPGLRQGIGDLSGQQLQNLTGRTWQNVEVIPDHGGSITKFIFIQRGEQVFSGPVKPNVHKLIMNIRGIEVTGYEVTDGSATSSAATQLTPK